MIKTLLERAIPEPNTGCWLWLGCVNNKGYGQVRRGGRTQLAHRASLAETCEVPAGSVVEHKCNTPACINPNHLFVSTQAANLQRMRAQGRGFDVSQLSLAKTHCPRGHEYTEDNMYRWGKRRICATCCYAAVKAYRARKRKGV